MSKHYISQDNANTIFQSYADKINIKADALATMPTASASIVNKTVIYTGPTTSTYTKGYIYKCVSSGSGYTWQAVSTGGGGGQDSNVICPDDYGAAGDGVTDDKNAFPEGNYIYNLSKGKTYLIKGKTNYQRICSNTLIGDGIIKGEWTEANKRVIFYQSTNGYPNKLVEDTNHLCKGKTYYTQKGDRITKEQSSDSAILPIEGYSDAHYHNIGAFYYDYDKVDLLPDTFTICLGRTALFIKKSSEQNWRKIIDVPHPNINGIKNYKVPWAGDSSREFDNKPVLVDDHIELVVKKTELTTWKGDASLEGVVHFWGPSYYTTVGECDQIICYQEAWVKDVYNSTTEKWETANHLLQFCAAVDNIYNGNTIKQAIFSSCKDITNYRQGFWECSMPPQEASAVDFDQLTALLESNEILDYDRTKRTSRNLITLQDCEMTGTKYKFKIENNVCSISMIDESQDPPSSAEKFVITNYFTQQLEPNTTYRFYMERLDRHNGNETSDSNLGTITIGKDGKGRFQLKYNEITGKYKGYPIDNSSRIGTIASKVVTTSSNFDPDFLQYAVSKTEYNAFRIWATKGEDYIPYEPYGEEIRAYTLNPQVITSAGGVTPTPTPKTNQKAVVIGDSFFDGTHFPSGTQYDFGEYLEAENIYTTVYNFGRAGAGFGANESNIKLSAMLQETEVINAIQNSDIMYLHLGGNDLVTASGVTSVTPETNILDVVRSELTTIYGINPNITIYFMPAADTNDLLSDVWIPATVNQEGMVGTIAPREAFRVMATQYQIDLAIAASDLNIMRFHTSAAHLITQRRTSDIHPTKQAAEIMFHEFIYGDYVRAYVPAEVNDIMNVFIPSSENTWINNALSSLSKKDAFSEFTYPIYSFMKQGDDYILMVVSTNRSYYGNNNSMMAYDFTNKKFVAMTTDPSTKTITAEMYPLNIQEVVAASSDFADFKTRMAAL